VLTYGGVAGVGGVDINGVGGVGGAGGAAGGGAAAATPASIYSLAMLGTGNMLAAGSSDNMVRIWDTRTGEKFAKLRGHTNNVRSLLIKDDSVKLLSGAADGTMRLWDLRMQRCVQVSKGSGVQI
jgi:WD repeat-containing protein 48